MFRVSDYDAYTCPKLGIYIRVSDTLFELSTFTLKMCHKTEQNNKNIVICMHKYGDIDDNMEQEKERMVCASKSLTTNEPKKRKMENAIKLETIRAHIPRYIIARSNSLIQTCRCSSVRRISVDMNVLMLRCIIPFNSFLLYVNSNINT